LVHEANETALTAELRYAQMLHQQGRLTDAESVYLKLLARRPKHFEALHLLGIIAFQTRRFERAVRLIEEAIALKPDCAEAYYNLGLALAELERPEEALSRYDQAITWKPDYVAAYTNRGNAFRNMGRPDEALRSYDEAIARQANYAEVHNNRGAVLMDLGRSEEALLSFERATALNPDHVAAYINRGNALRDLKRTDEALSSYDKAIALEPDLAELHSDRGLALMDLRRPEEALSSYDRAITLKPDYAAAYNNRGNALRDLGRPEEALASYDRAIRLIPDSAETHNNRGTALIDLGRSSDALACYDRAITLKPGYAVAYNNRGNALRDLGRPEEALASYDRAIAQKPDLAEFYSDRGHALMELRRPEEALTSYDMAITLKPGLAAAHAGMGTILQEVGQIDEAARCFERAIECEPRRPAHLLSLARAIKLTGDSPYLSMMLALADEISSFNAKDKTDLHFALGQALSDAGEHQRAFEHQIAGNALKRRTIVYDEADALGRLERTRSVFSSSLLRSRPAAAVSSSVPIFIVGMPRSGSTLVEQMLASHPNVFGAGEVEVFTDAGRKTGLFTPANPFPESVPFWTDNQLRDLAADYLERMQALAVAQASERPILRITDRLLSNFRYIGLISMVFPNAKIIHTFRYPIDTCLSCFSIPFQTQNFTFDLGELGRRYHAYSGLMAHWRSVLPPGQILEVQYENVVKNFEGEARRIVAYCGLDWDDACLRFHQTARPIRTASAVQVRQPVYQSSVRRWRPDQAALGPLLAALEAEDGPLDARLPR
jgi:tetratricopeptide (TPR) repeat protein